MRKVHNFKLLGGFRIWLEFENGKKKVVDLEPLLGKGFTIDLLDQSQFDKVFIESGGGLAWPNDYDVCPNYLYEMQEVKETATQSTT